MILVLFLDSVLLLEILLDFVLDVGLITCVVHVASFLLLRLVNIIVFKLEIEILKSDLLLLYNSFFVGYLEVVNSC